MSGEISRMDIIEALAKVVLVRDEYIASTRGGEGFPVRMSELTEIVSNYCEREIVYRKIKEDGHHIQGRLKKFPDVAYIDYYAWADTPLSRYIHCKELTHLIIDCEDSHVNGCVKLVEHLIQFSVSAFVQNEDFKSEMVAHFGAAELLYPFSKRDKDREALKSEKATLSDLAAYYNIPEYIVSSLLSDTTHDTARQIMNAVYQVLDRKPTWT